MLIGIWYKGRIYFNFDSGVSDAFLVPLPSLSESRLHPDGGVGLRRGALPPSLLACPDNPICDPIPSERIWNLTMKSGHDVSWVLREENRPWLLRLLQFWS